MILELSLILDDFQGAQNIINKVFVGIFLYLYKLDIFMQSI